MENKIIFFFMHIYIDSNKCMHLSYICTCILCKLFMMTDDGLMSYSFINGSVLC